MLRLALIVALAGCASAPRSADSTELEAAKAHVAQLEAELAEAQDRALALETELAAKTATEVSNDAAAAEASDDPGDDTRAPPARIFSREALDDQLHLYFPPSGLPEHFEPGHTAWREAELPQGFTEADAPEHPSAGAIATAVAAAVASPLLGIDLWEVTTRAVVTDYELEAMATILMWGLKDDAVQGEDWRLTLRRGEHGWFVESAERRAYCSRGVTDDQRCR